MRARLAATVLFCLLLAGCSSHETKFEERVPAAPMTAASTAELVQAAARVVLLYRDEAEGLPAAALASLTQASAIAFRASGVPGLRKQSVRYADLLLESRPQGARDGGFSGFGTPDLADAATTAMAVDALIDASTVTGRAQYRAAAVAGAKALTRPSLGLTRSPAGVLIRDPKRRGGRANVALTAQVAGALHRAASVGAPTATVSRQLFGSVAKAQEGLGRWYAYVGTRQPMDLRSWTTTLLAIAKYQQSPVEGIADAGVPALFGTGFTGNGVPKSESLPDPTGRGAASAISLFDAFPQNPFYARLTTQRALGQRRADGTMARASRDDVQVQALYALGFARRALTTGSSRKP